MLRPATAADIPALIDLYIEFHEFHARGLPDQLAIPPTYDRDWMRLELAKLIAREDAALLVVEDHALLLGFVEVALSQRKPEPLRAPQAYVLVQSLFVRAERRGSGFGTALIAAARAWAAERGAPELQLDTWEFDAGPLRFYERLGFRTLKRRLIWHAERP